MEMPSPAKRERFIVQEEWNIANRYFHPGHWICPHLQKIFQQMQGHFAEKYHSDPFIGQELQRLFNARGKERFLTSMVLTKVCYEILQPLPKEEITEMLANGSSSTLFQAERITKKLQDLSEELEKIIDNLRIEWTMEIGQTLMKKKNSHGSE